MWNNIRQFFKDWSYFRVMNKGAKFFDKNPVVQGRFEEVEDWLEHIEDRLAAVEENSHPCKELHEFDAYPELIHRLSAVEQHIDK